MAVLPDGTLSTLERWQRLTDNAFANVNPTTSSILAAYHASYPWMAPDAKWSLAKAGVDPASSTAQTAAYAAAHIETNQGLAFSPVGSPVTRPAGNVDTSSVFSALETKRQAKYAPSDTGAQYAATSQGPSQLETINPDGWQRLQPNEQQILSSVQITDAGNDPDQPGAKNYKVAGWDQLPFFWQQKVAELLTKAVDPNAGKFGQQREGFTSWNGNGVSFDNGTLVTGAKTIVDRYQQTTADNTGVLGALAPIERGAFMVGAAPYQEVVGQIRNVYELATKHDNPNWLQSQSDLGVAAGDIIHGRPVDVGSGFFVGANSGVAQERERRILERGQIGGHGITLGRLGANLIFQPGSKPYQTLSGLVDLAAAVKLDPAVKAGKEFSAAREASQTFAEGSVAKAVRTFHETGELQPALAAFRDAGGLTGIRPTVSKDAVNAWLDSPDQAPLLQHIADNQSPYSIWRGLNRQADPGLVARLAEADNPADVANLLRDELGTTIRYKPSARDVLSARTSTPSRWTSMMPAPEVDANDLQANAIQLERAASLTKAPSEDLSRWFDAMARTTDPLERKAVWEQMMHDTADRLAGRGIAGDRARTLTRLWQEQQSVDRVYAVRAVGDGQGALGQQAIVDGEQMVIPDNQPTMLAQTVDGQIPMPDWRELRTALAVKPLRAVLENPGIAGAEHALNRLQGTVWKALQVSTVKTMIKVVGDEQAAIAARGYDSLLNHPLSAMSMILATPLSELPEDAGYLMRLKQASSKLLRGVVEAIPGVEPKLTTTALGHDFETLDEVQKVASHGFNTASDELGVLHANDWKVLRYQPGVNDTEFAAAHARNLAQYAASPETRGFLQAGSLEQAQSWYWDGPGAQFRDLLSKSGRTGRPELLTRDGSDQFVADTLAQMNRVTNGNPDLLQAIATGRLDGTAIWNTVKDGTPKVSKNFIAKVQDYAADFPVATPQQKAIYSADLARRQVADGIFGRAIHTLLGTPSAVLSKSPLFRQAYWERIIDNAPYMTADAQNEAVRIAENEANLGKSLTGDLRQAIVDGNRNRDPFSGTLTLDQADEIAKGHGLDIVRRTTHEFSQRSQAFDMLRLLTPFGEVWRKTIQRWGNIIAENPQVGRRIQQGITAAMSPELGAFMGEPAGQGFFHPDQNGQEVFTVPGSEWATQALTGVPVPLVGDVKGLSLGTEFFPALGPVASIPVAWTLSKLNAPRSITETLFPYGPPKNLGDLWNYAPSWMQKAFGADRPTSPDSVRTFNNTIIDYIRYGATNGDYDLNTPEGIQHAFEDATGKAHTLNMIRGAAQFFVPGAPAPQLLVRDKSGKLLDATVLIQEFHDLQNADPNTAGQVFLDKYGPDIFKAVTPKSYSYTFGIPTSRDSADWVDAHSDVKRDLPHIFGYFAPPSDPNNFDYEVYRNQLEPGQGRAALSPEQWARLANSRLAAMQYGKARDKVDALSNGKPNDAQRAWLATVKANLIDEYPGYADALYGGAGLPSRPDPKLLIIEAQKALDNPTVKGTDAGQGLSVYMSKRAAVDKAWTDAGFSSGSWAQANGSWAISLRAYLRNFGALVTQDHAQFGPLFEGVFDREMRDDSNPAALTPGG